MLVQVGVLWAAVFCDAAGAISRDWQPGCLGCLGCFWMLVMAQTRVCEIDGRHAARGAGAGAVFRYLGS